VTLGPKDSLGISGVENFECVVTDTSDVFFVETVLINEEARVEARKQEYAAYL
jgi:hypothetical protein